MADARVDAKVVLIGDAAVGKTNGFGLVEKGPGHSFLEEGVAGRAPLVGIVGRGGWLFGFRRQFGRGGRATVALAFDLVADVVVGVVFETTQRGECLAAGGAGVGHVSVLLGFGPRGTGVFFCLAGTRSFP